MALADVRRHNRSVREYSLRKLPAISSDDMMYIVQYLSRQSALHSLRSIPSQHTGTVTVGAVQSVSSPFSEQSLERKLDVRWCANGLSVLQNGSQTWSQGRSGATPLVLIVLEGKIVTHPCNIADFACLNSVCAAMTLSTAVALRRNVQTVPFRFLLALRPLQRTCTHSSRTAQSLCVFTHGQSGCLSLECVLDVRLQARSSVARKVGQCKKLS